MVNAHKYPQIAYGLVTMGTHDLIEALPACLLNMVKI